MWRRNWFRISALTLLLVTSSRLIQASDHFHFKPVQSAGIVLFSLQTEQPPQKTDASPKSSASLTPAQAAPSPDQTPAQSGNSQTGEELFVGRIRFANGGPPCVACHSVSGIPFPNGGTMGPNLTDEYTKLGPEGMSAVLDTLFFVTMAPLYNNRPLTPVEQQDLTSFFQQTAQNQPHRGMTVEFGLVSLAGCLGLLVLNGFIWKKRLRGVRRNLVARVRREEVRE
jgi:hypothetical protein